MTIQITIDNAIRFREEDLPADLVMAIKAKTTFPNPQYAAALKHGNGRRPYCPEFIRAFKVVGRGRDRVMEVPRGLWSWLQDALDADRRILEYRWSANHRCHGATVPLLRSVGLRPYQCDALEETAKHNEAVAVMPTGSGKTVTACGLIAGSAPTLVIVHTSELLKQWQGAIKKFLGVKAGVIGGGKFDLQDVTVGMIQTLSKLDGEKLAGVKARFGAVVVDECHHVPAQQTFGFVGQMPAARRYGFTATPDRADGLTGLMHAVVGPEAYRITYGELYDLGFIMRPRVEAVQTGWKGEADPAKEYSRAVDEMVEDDMRCGAIVRVAREAMHAGRVPLVLTGRVSHASDLAEWIRDMGHSVALAVGDTRVQKKAEREAAILDVIEGRADCLVATTLADEGLDIPRLDTLIMATPTKSETKCKQRIGRIMRPLEGKKTPLVYDLCDAHGVFIAQSKARQRVYREMGVEL